MLTNRTIKAILYATPMDMGGFPIRQPFPSHKAEQIDDAPARELAIEAIEEAFENNELDYGRKLYLIENCIYGVDIQPIAVQISKLRFFISLIVEQKTNFQKDNLGIRPLPNLINSQTPN